MRELRKHKFTIIVPTVSREKEFKGTLRTVTAERYENLEILVQGNGVKWPIEQFISSLGDQRIKCVNNEETVPMAKNWTSAIETASGDFLFILGDDDGWYAGSLETVNRIFNEFPDLNVVTWKRDDYGWDDAVPCIRNRFLFSAISKFQFIKTKDLLREIFADNLSHEYLPKIYSSFIRRSILQKFLTKYGSYFLDHANPDICTGVQVLVEDEIIFRSEIPFSIIGTSGSSNGANSLVFPVEARKIDVSPEASVSELWNLGVDSELGILNTYLRCVRLLSIKEPYNLATEGRFLRYLQNIESKRRPIVLQTLANSQFWTKLSEDTQHQLRTISDSGLPQPVLNPSSTDSKINLSEQTLIGSIYTQKFGLLSIDQAACFALKLRRGI